MNGAVDQILDLARWAPSGDNTQPWRFEVVDDNHIVIHGVDTEQTRMRCVYDLDGHPTQISLGALIETLTIAATGFGFRAEVKRRPQGDRDTEPVFDVKLVPQPDLQPNPLIAAIPRRSVQRRRLQTSKLSAEEKHELEQSLGSGYRVRWFESKESKWQLARLMFKSAKIRLTTEEAYRVHKEIIAWGSRFSDDRVPDQSLGADPVALKFMRWAMRDWRRVQLLNRFLAGTWLPRLQMDLLPAMMSGAHVALISDHAPETIDDYVAAGRCVQRFWLTATSLGLQKQPEITPLIFSRFSREDRIFTKSAKAQRLAGKVEARAERVIGPDLANVVWLARLGRGPAAQSRSQRRSRADLDATPGWNESNDDDRAVLERDPGPVTSPRVGPRVSPTEFSPPKAAMREPVALLQGVYKSYQMDAVEIPVLKQIDILIRPGHFTVVLGPSGSGKTTLLNVIGCLDRPDRGAVTIAGSNVGSLSDDELTDFRARNIGFIFQNFNLLPVLTAYENIEYPMLLAGLPPATRANRVNRLLQAVGLTDRARNRPGQLSGGQRQRVAIARALALRPKLVIADEPTANLDSRTGAEILNLMRHMQQRHGISFLFSSHDRAVIGAADDTITLIDGEIRSIERRKADATADEVAEEFQ